MKKKIMGIMLGLSLVVGAASVAFAFTPNPQETTKKKKKPKTGDRSVVQYNPTVR